jgi:TfoX/Sxy family transcriptional regulator of competence genes
MSASQRRHEVRRPSATLPGMASPHGGGWTKSPPELVERFAATVAEVPGISQRQMFGYPAAFTEQGHMFTGLHQDRWVLRLPEDARAEIETLGATPFEPMRGRPMTGFVVLPASLVEDPEALSPWLERSLAYARALPPKAPRRR